MADALATAHSVAQKVLGALRRVRLASSLPTITTFILVQHHQSEVVTATRKNGGEGTKKRGGGSMMVHGWCDRVEYPQKRLGHSSEMEANKTTSSIVLQQYLHERP